jgi:hypothetical protein
MSDNGSGHDGAPPGNVIAVEDLRQAAVRLLREAIAAGSSEEQAAIAARIAPRPQDFPRAFTGPAAEAARIAHAGAWRTPPVLKPGPGQSNVIAWAARAADLGPGAPAAEFFPGGYGAIVDRLMPDRVWVAWKFIEPGQTRGTAYDGLVWLDDRWAWFPKPWRLFR